MSHGNNNVIGSFQGDLHRDTCNVMTNVMTHCLDSSYVSVRLIRRKVIIIRLTQSFDDHRTERCIECVEKTQSKSFHDYVSENYPVWRGKLRTVPNNSYGFLKYFESDLRDFLSGIWRRNARLRIMRSRHVFTHTRVCERNCQRGQCLFLSFIYHERDRTTRCEIASDIGTLISVTGDNEPLKGCRVS